MGCTRLAYSVTCAAMDSVLTECHKRMVITHRKDLCQGDYLIDDRGKNGTSEFAGEWIEFGSEKFPDWNSVLAYFGVVSQEHLDIT